MTTTDTLEPIPEAPDSERSLLDPPEGPEDDDRPPPDRSDEEIRALVELALPHIAQVAAVLKRQLGSVAELDELASVGRMAAFHAARAYDPKRSAFVTFVRKRVRWAMIDAVRRDTHGRSIRARAMALRAMDEIREAAVKGPPDPTLPESVHAKKLTAILEAQAAAMATAFVAAAPSAEPASAESAPSRASAEIPEKLSRPFAAVPQSLLPRVETATPEDWVAQRRFADAIRAAIARLPERHREIVERHYFGDERFDHIAQSLGLSKSWVSRLHAQAMESLARAMRNHR